MKKTAFFILLATLIFFTGCEKENQISSEDREYFRIEQSDLQGWDFGIVSSNNNVVLVKENDESESKVVQAAVEAGFEFNGKINGIALPKGHGPHLDYNRSVMNCRDGRKLILIIHQKWPRLKSNSLQQNYVIDWNKS